MGVEFCTQPVEGRRVAILASCRVKGVGVDGFNAYLIKKAPTAVQRGYWEDLKEAIRTRTFPEEWRERVAMLAMKPGEDPVDLERRRDLWRHLLDGYEGRWA